MTSQSPIHRPMTGAEWSLLLLLSLVWGGSFFFNAVAVRDIPPITVVAGRVSIAAAVLAVIARARGVALPREARVWRAFAVMSVLNNILPFTLIVWAQSHIASGVAAILNATTPLFTVVAAHFMTSDERLTPGRAIGVLLGFVGVAVMIGLAALQSLSVDIVAEGACLLASGLYAVSAVYGRRFSRFGLAPLATVTGVVGVSSLILVPLALIVDRPWTLPQPGATAIAGVACLALISTAFAYVLYFRLLATAGASNLVLVTFLLPVTAMLLGVLFLGETVHARQFAGMALIGLGLAAIDGRLPAGVANWMRARAEPDAKR